MAHAIPRVCHPLVFFWHFEDAMQDPCIAELVASIFRLTMSSMVASQSVNMAPFESKRRLEANKIGPPASWRNEGGFTADHMQ